MDNPEKPTTCGTQDEDKQTKQKHNTIYVGHHYAQTNKHTLIYTMMISE